MKRLLILSASSGRGHVAAARAIAAALEAEHAGIHLRHDDLFDHVAMPIRMLGREGYDLCVNWTPFVWRLAYAGSDGRIPPAWPDALVNALCRRYLAVVSRFRPDRILSTYWSAGPMLSSLRRAAGRRVPLSIVITDADLHGAWLSRDADLYYVSDPGIRDRLAAWGHPADRIVVSGIPAHPRFRPVNREEARRTLGLTAYPRWLLIVAGPRAMRPLAARAAEIRRARPDLGVVVLAGPDQWLLGRMAEAARADDGLVLAGMIPDMERWMGAADLLVAKGGGLITAEATAVGKPVLIHRPIPGQEEANARRLEGEGAARVVKGFTHLLETVTALLGDGAGVGLDEMTAAARRVGRPDAAAVIARSEAERLSG